MTKSPLHFELILIALHWIQYLLDLKCHTKVKHLLEAKSINQFSKRFCMHSNRQFVLKPIWWSFSVALNGFGVFAFRRIKRIFVNSKNSERERLFPFIEKIILNFERACVFCLTPLLEFSAWFFVHLCTAPGRPFCPAPWCFAPLAPPDGKALNTYIQIGAIQTCSYTLLISNGNLLFNRWVFRCHISFYNSINVLRTLIL